MAKEKIDLRRELLAYKEQFNLIQKIPCTKEENKLYSQLIRSGKPLPQNVVKYEYPVTMDYDEFYTVYIPDVSAAEIQEYLTYKQLALLNTIKNCVMFFTILTIVSLVGGFLLLAAS